MPNAARQKLTFCYEFASLLLISSTITFAATNTTTTHWQGPYIGAYLGGGFSNNHLSTDTGNVTDTSYFTNSADINAINNAGTSTQHPSQLIAGIQAGHDWTWQQMVYGVATDYGTMPLSSSYNVNNAAYPNSADTYSVSTSMNTNWLFTLRGRIGYQTTLRWPSLLYVTGGMAITQLTVNNTFSDTSPLTGTAHNSASENQIGWVLGAGIEIMSFSHASIDLEYLYVKVPNVKVTSALTNTADGFGIPAQSLTNPFSTSAEFHANLLRLGLNYRFDE